jgi:isoleucyl-tRNA synthetase
MSDKTAEKKVSDTARREEEILAFWEREGIFAQSLQKESPKGEYVFYDGPPFATGLPHHGHILAGTIKDTIPRYRTMQGYRVARRWGWDCHGLPLENQIEAKLGLKTKRDIEELGVEKFNKACFEAVLEYADDWKKIIPRLGRWVDMDDDYKTMDSSYTESVMWVFSELAKKGLVYEGYKSMHLCPRCGTTLSNFEVNQGYKDIKDISVTVKLTLLDAEGKETDTSLLVWTTTPWTLPGNMAAAVHKEFDYVQLTFNFEGELPSNLKNLDIEPGKTYIASEQFWKNLQIEVEAETHGRYIETDVQFVARKFKGAELVGRSYVPPFSYYADLDIEGKANAWKVYHADYVTLTDGVGAVHLAPAYGEEDMVLAQKEGIPVVHHVDQEGRFMAHVTDLAGRAVKPKDDKDAGVLHTDADVEVLKRLKESGRLFAKENIVHSYRLVAENKKIAWVPDHIGSARFGNWLEGARDWAVSRQRYWGAPIPVWRNKAAGTYEVLGSLDEIKARAKRSGNTYLIMRHGEAESNVAGVVNCDKDSNDGLTETGRAQAQEAAAKLKEGGVDIIYHSGFARTRETAEIVREALGLSVEQVIEDERLAELRIGPDYEGKTWAEYNAHFPTWEARYLTHVGTLENRRDIQRRMGEVLYGLEEKYAGKKILIVGHGGALFGMECAAAGADIEASWELRQSRGYLKNAEVRPLDFTPIPHNRDFVLDYHRPYIDEIELVDQDGAKLERVPDVFDCWFESGSMPYGQQHYPFSNTDVFDPRAGKGYPADFISESVDQTRGWFYSLIVLGIALFGVAPYKHVITNGLVLAEDGRKMSKKLKNYPDPIDVVDQYGADTLRFYLLSSPIIRGEDLNFSEKNLAELSRKNLGRLANVLSFYELYKDADADPKDALGSTNVLDRWIIARLNEVVAEATAGFEAYELDRATRPITGFIDDLSVWYLRRSRERLKYGDQKDQLLAIATLRYVLQQLALVMAPSMPFYADHLFRAVRAENDPVSVHLASWPHGAEIDRGILEEMRITRDTVTKALELRAEANIKVRQPLQSLTVKHELHEAGKPFHELVMAEVNIKELKSDPSLEKEMVLDVAVTPELQAEGEVRELMRHIQDMRKEAGLMPEDRIALMIDTDEDGIEGIKTHQAMLERTVGAASLSFGPVEGGELTLPERTYRVSLSPAR